MARTFLRMGLLVLAAYLYRRWMFMGHPGGLGDMVMLMAETTGAGMRVAFWASLGVALLLCLYGALRGGFWRMILALFGVALLVSLEPFQSWQAVVPLPSHFQLALVFLLLLAHALLWVAPRPVFRSGKLLVRDGRDHLAVQKGEGDVTVFQHGRVLCTLAPEKVSETRYGGGTSSVPTTSTVVTYGPNGTNYGTVYGSQTVSTPIFSYQAWRRTGRLEYSLQEVGIDHALLVAKRPKHLVLIARHQASHREKSTAFTLGPWASFRFELWRRFHAGAFFRKDPAVARRIAKATREHLDEMKKRFGRISAHELRVDHDLKLVSFAGLAGDKVFVHVANPPAELTVPKQEANTYWQGGMLRIPGHPSAIAIGGKIATKLSEWSQLAAIRKDRR